MSWPRTSTCVTVLLLALLLNSSAQQQDSSGTVPTFSSNSELVLVPVHVMDHWGRPLHGLKQEAFQLKSDGNPQHIAFFEEVQQPPLPAVAQVATVSAPAAAPTASSVKFSNAPVAESAQNALILAIDTVNTPLLLQSWTRQQVIGYLRSHPATQPIAIVAISPSGLRQIHQFSTDTTSLIESVQKMHSGFTRRDSQEMLVEKMDRNGRIGSYTSLVNQQEELRASNAVLNVGAGSLTLHSFEELALAYSGIPGRKTVLWLTSGFPLMEEVADGPSMIGHSAVNTGTLPYSSGHHQVNQLLPEFQRAFTALNKSNVIIYPVDVNGLPLEDMWDVSSPAGLYVHPELSHFSGPLPDTTAADRDGMKELARRTGGKPCTAGNNLQNCLDQALAESSDYYLLGFYVSQQQRKVGWHKLKVSLDVDHGEVRARSTYFLRALGSAPEQEQRDDLRSAINAVVEYTGVIFSIELGKRNSSSQTPIPFKISVPATSLLLQPGQERLSFDVIAIPLSADGKPLNNESRVVKLDMNPEVSQRALLKGWNLIDSVQGKSTIAAVKVIIRDNENGRIGSVVFSLTPLQTGG